MAKRFKIVLKGTEDPIFLSYKEGLELAEDLRQGKISGMIQVAGHYITVGSIRSIHPEDDSSKAVTDSAERLLQEERGWQQEKARRLSLSPKERAQETGFFNLISQGLRGRPLTEEEKGAVIAAQEVYFTENPNMHAANPRCYFTDEDISRAQARLPSDDRKATHIKDLFPRFVLDYAERHLIA